MKRAILLCCLAACPAQESRTSTASFELEGALRGARAVDDRGAGRVTCTVDRDASNPLDPTPAFTLAITAAADGREAAGLYFTVRDFRGAGSYTLDATTRGKVLLFDAATVEGCADPDDRRCYVAEEGCSLIVERLDLGAVVAPGVKNGTATGRFDCVSLENPVTEQSVRVSSGAYSCRASDWTASR